MLTFIWVKVSHPYHNSLPLSLLLRGSWATEVKPLALGHTAISGRAGITFRLCSQSSVAVSKPSACRNTLSHLRGCGLWPIRKQPWVKILGPTVRSLAPRARPLACCYHVSSGSEVFLERVQVAGFSQLARTHFDIYRSSSVIQLCSYKVSLPEDAGLGRSMRMRTEQEAWVVSNNVRGVWVPGGCGSRERTCGLGLWASPGPSPSLSGSGLSSGLVSESEASAGK